MKDREGRLYQTRGGVGLLLYLLSFLRGYRSFSCSIMGTSGQGCGRRLDSSDIWYPRSKSATWFNLERLNVQAQASRL